MFGHNPFGLVVQVFEIPKVSGTLRSSFAFCTAWILHLVSLAKLICILRKGQPGMAALFPSRGESLVGVL